MVIAALVFLGGVLTIFSPCILPVLPFVFARSDRRFATSGLPMLLGMAVTFAGIATLAAVGGAWAVRVNQYGRLFALVLLTLFAITLLSTRLAEWIARPFVLLGNRLLPTDGSGAGGNGVASSLLLGGATGLLWAPCAGPVLGLVLTGAALSGPNARTTLLLFAYAAGACTSLGVALLAGGRVFAAMKRSLGAGEWIRRALGVAILLAVVAIALGWDNSVLTRLSLTGTNRVEQTLLDKFKSSSSPDRGADGLTVASPGMGLPIEGVLPSLGGATAWLNSAPLTAEDLRGKVVLVDFWTYSCINCLRTLPYVKAWYEKYRDHGLVVVGVHTPEFAFEKDERNVEQAVAELHVDYPVALDNDYVIWRRFNNHYWPAHYFIDAAGKIRAHHFSEGAYDESENVIRQLLIEAGHTDLPPAGTQATTASGVEAATDLASNRSPETYVGYRRAEGFRSPGGIVKDGSHAYSAPSFLDTNQWALSGTWAVDGEKAVSKSVPGSIQYRFSARDLHLVLGPDVTGKPVRFRVLLDGRAPGADHGVDVDANGDGVVTEQRLYQLIRESGDTRDHTFTIEFLDDGVQAYAFTFG
jgi:cytochrome c biogenesis protein CcdA/thiol-disulfide isomerase/thioredoxin